MTQKPLLYFKNHEPKTAVELAFYNVDSEFESMPLEDAVKAAICYEWIDITLRELNNERRKQNFTPRKDKSVWSKINKNYIEIISLCEKNIKSK